jgi:hypothetical protein
MLIAGRSIGVFAAEDAIVNPRFLINLSTSYEKSGFIFSLTMVLQG